MRRELIGVLRKLGADAHEAYPALLQLALTDPDEQIRATAEGTLGVIGPATKYEVHGLAALLKDPDARIRREAAVTLGRIGSAALNAIPELVRAQKDTDAGVRDNAVSALDALGVKTVATVPELIKSLQSADTATVSRAVLVLAGFGEQAKPALPALAELLENPKLCAFTVRALCSIGPEAMPVLARTLNGGSVAIQRIVIKTLADMGSEARVATPVLDKLMQTMPPGTLADESKRALEKIRRR